MDIQAIEREIQQEAKIDKTIEKLTTRWFKQHKHFRRVDTREKSTAMIIFNRAELHKYTLIYNEENNPTLDSYMNDDRLTVIFVRNTNPRDRNKNTLGCIRKMDISKKVLL